MIASLIKKLFRDSRAATAVALAIMTVPLLICASAAVDFARVASARTLLQASVNSAATAGVGAFVVSASNTNADNVALASYAGTSSQLPKFVTTGSPTVNIYCSGTSSCGTATATGATASCTTAFALGDNYCVVVSASGTLKNSLFSWLIPSELLSVSATSGAQAPGSTTTTYSNINSDQQSGFYASGSGNNITISSYHEAGTGSLPTNSTSGNSGTGVADFEVFLDGNNAVLPASNLYKAPTKNSSDPCPSGSSSSTSTVSSSTTPFSSLTGQSVSCNSNGGCTIPAGTYCGNLTAANYTVNTLTSTTSYPAFYVEDGNLTEAPNAVFCPSVNTVSSANNSQCTTATYNYTPIYFGGANIGQLLLQQNTAIDPAGITNGTINYVSNFFSQSTQTSGARSVLSAGVCEDALAYCTSGALSGSAIVYSGAGTVTYNDTYITALTVVSGVETAWLETEVLATEFTPSGKSSPTSETTETVKYGGSYPKNVISANSVNSSSSYASSSYSSNALSQFTCSSETPTGVTPSYTTLFSTTTASTSSTSSGNPNFGYSYASAFLEGSGLLTETIVVCGNGAALAVSGNSGSSTVVTPTTLTGYPTLIN